MNFKKSLGCLGLAALVSCGGLWGLIVWADRTEQQQQAQVAAANDAAASELAKGKGLGYAAAVAGQSAATPSQWLAVADRWQAAIDVLDAIPYGTASHAEAQGKVAEYRKARIAALGRRADAERAMGTDTERYMAWVRTIDPQGLLVSKVTVDPSQPDTVEVTVTAAFLAQSPTLQREGAAGLQAGWAKIYSPTAPDDARLRLLTPSGKRFGGSRAIAGTMIYIDD